MRDQAKTVNFATLYGQGPFSPGPAARHLDGGREAVHFAQYFERFAGVRRFLDEQVAQAKELGYVATLLGRRRRIVPELRARAWNVRQFGERVAQNTPIQGTAADLIKVAMIRIRDVLLRRATRKSAWSSRCTTSSSSRSSRGPGGRGYGAAVVEVMESADGAECAAEAWMWDQGGPGTTARGDGVGLIPGFEDRPSGSVDRDPRKPGIRSSGSPESAAESQSRIQPCMRPV